MLNLWRYSCGKHRILHKFLLEKKKLTQLQKKKKKAQPNGKNPNFVHSSFDSVFAITKFCENAARNKVNLSKDFFIFL